MLLLPQVELPDLISSDCIADLKLRKKIRMDYPGACSIEFQNIMDIVIETLFNWDIKKQEAKGPGIFGTVVAFAPADEEQGRKTLHRHIQIWVKEIDQKLRKDLFQEDKDEKEKARTKFQNYIDKIMSTTFGPDLLVPTSCSDAPPQTFRDARHKKLCEGTDGQVIKCGPQHKMISPETLINHSLLKWRNHALGDSMDHNRGDTFLPLNDAKIDMAAYCYSYHMNGGSNEIADDFWANKNIRQLYLRKRFDHHECTHRHSCFKKSCECRFMFPFSTCSETYIHEDKGFENENEIIWHNLDLNGTYRKMAPWMVIPKRRMGCQYVNVHNRTLSEIFNCNTNVQVGDPFHMYYITLYNLKSTQEEDSERSRRVAQTITRRLIRIQDEIRAGLRDKCDEEGDFVEGLCRMLGGMYAATSHYVVSATMAHLLICQDGTRFKFSHNFSDLLVGQMEASLEGKPVDFRLRVNRHKKEKIAWKDSLSDDYIHRPSGKKNGKNFEDMCSYELSRRYKKKYLTFSQMGKIQKRCDELDTDEEDDNLLSPLESKFSGKKYPFKSSHPGSHFSHLAELNLPVIPKISLPGGKLCDIELLKMTESVADEAVEENREYYAKMALLMFYPFRTLEDLKADGSYWKKFEGQLQMFSEDQKNIDQKKNKNKKSNMRSERRYKFWPKGFEILQNFQDRFTLEKKLRRARDPILLQTKLQQPDATDTKNSKNADKEALVPDITDLLSQFS